MNRRPEKLLSLNLGFPFFEGREFLVILVKVLEEFFKKLVNLFVNPRSVLELDNEIKSVNH